MGRRGGKRVRRGGDNSHTNLAAHPDPSQNGGPPGLTVAQRTNGYSAGVNSPAQQQQRNHQLAVEAQQRNIKALHGGSCKGQPGDGLITIPKHPAPFQSAGMPATSPNDMAQGAQGTHAAAVMGSIYDSGAYSGPGSATSGGGRRRRRTMRSRTRRVRIRRRRTRRRRSRRRRASRRKGTRRRRQR